MLDIIDNPSKGELAAILQLLPFLQLYIMSKFFVKLVSQLLFKVPQRPLKPQFNLHNGWTRNRDQNLWRNYIIASFVRWVVKVIWSIYKCQHRYWLSHFSGDKCMFVNNECLTLIQFNETYCKIYQKDHFTLNIKGSLRTDVISWHRQRLLENIVCSSAVSGKYKQTGFQRSARPIPLTVKRVRRR